MPTLKRSKKSDVIHSVENLKRKRVGSGADKGKDKLTNSINEEVKNMVLKIEQERGFTREDSSIANGKGGGEKLEFYCDDFQNNYEYSTKDSLKERSPKIETDVLLRPVSEMDEYNEE